MPLRVVVLVGGSGTVEVPVDVSDELWVCVRDADVLGEWLLVSD